MSKPEFILAVKTSVLEYQNLNGDEQALYLADVPHILPYLQNDLVLGQREALESDETHRQLLPYVVLTKQFGDVTKYFAYRRGKGVGEARLSGNVSIGVGGHIDLADVQHVNSVIDPMATIITSVQRELEEEIQFTNVGGKEEGEITFVSIGVIADNSDAVGRVHFGLAFAAKLDEDTEANCAEDELETLGWFTAKELLCKGLPIESWSKILLEEFAEVEE